MHPDKLPPAPETLSLDGHSLARPDVVRIARGPLGASARVTMAEPAAARVREVRRYVEERWLSSGAPSRPVYGFNTGVGVLKNREVRKDDLSEFQRRYIRSHCVGVGAPFPPDEVRAAILVRANSLASGHSGVRLEMIEALLELLNRGLTPVVPEIGSLGASGDLAPLSHVGAVLTGEPEAQVWSGEGIVPVAALPKKSFSPFALEAKEAMALTNGTSFMLGVLALAVSDAEHLLRQSDVCAAMSVEAMLGEMDAFDARLQSVRGHRGQERVAANLRTLLAGGERIDETLREEFRRRRLERRLEREAASLRDAGIDAAKLLEHRLRAEHSPRVQDAYSLRCVPQVHGASREAVHHVAGIVDRELNAVTDNPLLFAEGDELRALSGGNFHGQPLALAADYLCLALAELGSISERRIFRLLDEELSYGLPQTLTGGEPGINTGLMLLQYTAAALVSENKTYCHPASVDSIPSSGDQEDHVSMGLWACRKARIVAENVRRILALELLCSAQGLDLQSNLLGRERSRGIGVEAGHRAVRAAGIAPVRDDRYLGTEIERALELLRDGGFMASVEGALGTALA